MAANARGDIAGPIDLPQERSSGLVLLPTNKTLIAMPFQGTAGSRMPKEIPAANSKSTESVMEWADPEVKVNIKTGNPDNAEVSETIHFSGGVEAFSPKSIKKNSPWLRKLEAEFQSSEALVDRIDKNAQFRKALDDPNARAAVVAMLQEIITELDASLPPKPDN